MNPNPQKLRDISACEEGVAAAAKYATLREWWLKTDRRGDMMWLLGRAHVCGTLSRRSLVKVAVALAATVETPSTKPTLDALRAWVAGDESVDLSAVRDAAYAADAHNAAAARAAALAAACAAAADAAAAAAARTNAAADAVLKSIREAVTIDEIAAALDMDPDQGVA